MADSPLGAGVRADVAGLLASWHASPDETIEVLLECGVLASQELIPVLGRAIEEANTEVRRRLPELGEFCGAERPIVAAEGPVFEVGASEADLLVTYLDILVGALSATGARGLLVAAPNRVPPSWDAPGPACDRGYAAIVALSGWVEWQPGNHKVHPVWRNGTEIADLLTDFTTGWLKGIEGPQVLRVYGAHLIPPDEMPTLLHHLIADQDARRFFHLDTKTAKGHGRGVGFTMQGHLIVHEACNAHTAAQARINVTAAVTRLAHHTDYIALLATGLARPADVYGALRNDRGLRLSHYYNSSRYLDRQNLPDAFEWQIVTDQHLSRARSLEKWIINDLGEGMHRLVAPDLEAWHDPEIRPAGVSPEVLRRARREFGYLILGNEPWS